MPRVSFTSLRRNLATHLDRVERDHADLVVVRRNREDLVIIPRAELEGLRETLHLLSSPANAERLLQSIAQLDAGLGLENPLVET